MCECRNDACALLFLQVFANFAGLVQDKLGLPSKRAAALVYMLFHLVSLPLEPPCAQRRIAASGGMTLQVACTASFGFALLCYQFYLVHTLFVVGMLLSATLSGAKPYSYYMLDLYEEAVRDNLSSPARKEYKAATDLV